jgi:Raf kinase inhibitor-like YbhB/YbcL family protein
MLRMIFTARTALMASTLGAVALAFAADQASTFTLTSPDIAQGKAMTTKQVFNGFGCTGQNVSPALSWKNPPQGTKSFALMVYDPDAPTGSGWWHWVVYNIPATTLSLPEDAGNVKKNLLPAAAQQGRTDFGTLGFGGACPPPGKPHRYFFRLHALKVPKIEVPADASPAMIGFNVNANTIEKAEIMATYGR